MENSLNVAAKGSIDDRDLSIAEDEEKEKAWTSMQIPLIMELLLHVEDIRKRLRKQCYQVPSV